MFCQENFGQDCRCLRTETSSAPWIKKKAPVQPEFSAHVQEKNGSIRLAEPSFGEGDACAAANMISRDRWSLKG